jgi:hypothetical protein
MQVEIRLLIRPAMSGQISAAANTTKNSELLKTFA